jgi:hypothetical protein
LWKLQVFRNNFISFLNELGMSKEEIELRLKEEKDKKKIKQK